MKRLLGKPVAPARPTAPPLALLTPELEPDEIQVPEITAAALRSALHGDQPPLLLDVREPYEWRQVRIPAARHLPMNSVPQRLAELPDDRPIVVFCAHGSRSFGVAYYLRTQGFDACNLTGGITQWCVQGGEVEVRTTL
ncbi:MAG: sulfurtransferase [Caldilineaceae bacterium]|nr:sulfurtransferase [Caldilineaceae bacterium]